MLKMSGVKLELISDIDMYLFLKKYMRGGISCTAKRYSKANNKYMKSYDDSKPSKYITYLDINNLYGWTMSQYLPYSGFNWLNQKEINGFDVNLITENSLDGYLLEVDLKYLDELHESHNDYLFTPEKHEISRYKLSEYCSIIADQYSIKVGCVNKLVPKLNNKGRYVLHYSALQLYLSLGIKLIKVHRILKLKQSDWLKKYIDFNTDKRKNTVKCFEKRFLKLMNNKVYGKIMENFKKGLFSKNFVAIHEIKPVLTLDKLISVVFSILDLSKLLMYEFHYNDIGVKYGSGAKLLFTDTNSLVYEIDTDDVYEDKFYKDKVLKICGFMILLIKM